MAIVDYVIVDAFASDPFTGNPAAVIVLDGPLPDETLQAVSRYVSLAEFERSTFHRLTQRI